MASWRDQRAEKERVEREREEAAAAAKKAKLANLSSDISASSSTTSTEQVPDNLALPSLGLSDDAQRRDAEEKRIGGHMKRSLEQEAAAPVVHIKQVTVTSQKPAHTALALLKPSTTEVVFKNQWLPNCSEGAESRSKIHEIYQVKPNPDIMQTFEESRTALESAKPGQPLKTLYLFLGTTEEKGETILNQGVGVAFPNTVVFHSDPIQAIAHAENKEVFCCRVALGTPDIHYAVSADGQRYTMKFGKHAIATYVFKLA